MKQKLPNCLSGGVLRALSLLTLLLTLGLTSYAATGSFIVPTTIADGGKEYWPNCNQYNETHSMLDGKTVAGVQWTCVSFSNNNWNNSWGQMRCGRSSAASTAKIYSNGAVSYAINKVTASITTSKTWKLFNSAKLYVADNVEFTNASVYNAVVTSNGNTVDFPTTSNKTGVDYELEFTILNPTSNSYYKIEFDFGATGNNGALGLNKLEFNYEESTDLGAIMCNGAVANGQNLSGNKGDEFTFTAANAESMTLTEGGNTVSGTNSVVWVAPAVTEDTEYTLNIIANQGANQETATVKVIVKPAALCGEVVFNPAAGEIVKGSFVTITCENAEQIRYWFNDDEASSTTVSVDDASVQINNNCTLHAVGINADEKEGVSSSAEYTVVDAPEVTTGTALFDFTNEELIQSLCPGLVAGNTSSNTNILDGKSLQLNGVTVALSAGTNTQNVPRWCTVNNDVPELRLYQYNTMTISVAAGSLSKITYTMRASGSNTTFNAEPNTGSVENGVWTPTFTRANGDGVTSVTFTGNKVSYIKTITVNYDTPTGITGIEAEAGEAVYYNLQGVRVENPVKGLYIRVANGKSQKVIL